MSQDPTKKLTKLTLRLISKDLKRISAFKLKVDVGGGQTKLEDPPPGVFALTLSRYFSALTQHRRAIDKIEDEQRKALSKLPTKELKRLAGIEK